MFRRMTRRLSVVHHAFGTAHSSERPREQAAPASTASGVAGSA